MQVPPLTDTSTLAKSLGWSVQNTRRFLVTLEAEHGGLLKKVGRRYKVATERLMQVYPALSSAIIARQLETDDDD